MSQAAWPGGHPGIPLPTELTGKAVTEYLIDDDEQAERLLRMKKVCLSCHSSRWTDNHFASLDRAVETTNRMTLTATHILMKSWEKGLAEGIPRGSGIFDEEIEKMWVEQWLFYANSIRFASAMAGTDYGVFANGRWYLSRNIQEMLEWLELRSDRQ